MTPDDENRRLALAVDTLEMAASALKRGVDGDLPIAANEVRKAMAAIQEIQRARSEYLTTADVWTVLDLIVAEFTSDRRSQACFDERLVARAIVLNREHRREPEVPDRRPDTLG
jgi:hypothetical protein